MGHWHFWTTPEEVGEKQPLALEGLPFRIVFDGRLDNRFELFNSLDIDLEEGRQLSDTALVLRAYDYWGEECFEHFIGEFASVIFDEKRNEVICTRDHLGDRTLFYTFYEKQFIVASEPWSIVAATYIKPKLNDRAIAHYFALRIPEDGQTFFDDIYELLPAHSIKVSPDTQHSKSYWQPNIRKKIRYKTDEEYAEHFLSLLEESVRCRLRSSLPTGVLMSGGLDSTSVACLAARMIAPKKLTTLSYVFDKFPQSDERQYIAAVEERCNIRSVQFSGDESWTFNDWKNWPLNPNAPNRNFYRLLLENTYKNAKKNSLGVLLTGYMADHLFSTGSDWIADMIIDGKIIGAIKELIFQIKNIGWKKTASFGHFRHIIRRILYSIHPEMMRLSRRNYVPAWITPEYAGDLRRHQYLRPIYERNSGLLGLSASNDVAHATQNTSVYGIELRNPYRDRRLIEFAIAIPAYQCYYHGLHKFILRTAMQGVLPEPIRTRVERTSFEGLYFQGVEKEKKLFESYFKTTKKKWHKFISEDWHSNIPDFIHAAGIEVLLPFSCIAFENWCHYFNSEN